jgi:predicted RNA-binding protein with PUA-like domain
MNFWLVKSEPSCWSWSDHLAKGKEPWDGVRNHQANGYMKTMRLGDQALFYHSQKERACVGLLEVCTEWHPDPNDESGRFGMVTFQALRALSHPVSLDLIKSDPRLTHLALLKQSRLSVVPIDAEAWAIILEIAGDQI